MVLTIEKWTFMLTMALFFQALLFDCLGILDKYATALGLFQFFSVVFTVVYVVPLLPSEAVLTPTMAVAVNVKEIAIVKSYAMHVMPMHVYMASQPMVSAMMVTSLLGLMMQAQTFVPTLPEFVPSLVHPDLSEFLPLVAREVNDIGLNIPTLNAMASMTFFENAQDMINLTSYFGGHDQVMWWFANFLSHPLPVKEFMTEVELSNMVRCYNDDPDLLSSMFRGFAVYMQNLLEAVMSSGEMT